MLKTSLHADILVGGSRGEEQDGDALHRRNFHPGFINFSNSYMSQLQEFDGDALYRRNFYPGSGISICHFPVIFTTTKNWVFHYHQLKIRLFSVSPTEKSVIPKPSTVY